MHHWASEPVNHHQAFRPSEWAYIAVGSWTITCWSLGTQNEPRHRPDTGPDLGPFPRRAALHRGDGGFRGARCARTRRRAATWRLGADGRSPRHCAVSFPSQTLHGTAVVLGVNVGKLRGVFGQVGYHHINPSRRPHRSSVSLAADDPNIVRSGGHGVFRVWRLTGTDDQQVTN